MMPTATIKGAVLVATVLAAAPAPWVARTPVTIEVETAGFAETGSGGTWTMPDRGGLYCDGISLEDVAFTRNPEPGHDAIFRTYDVVVELRASAKDSDLSTDLVFELVDGERQLPLGRFREIRVEAGERTRVSRSFTVSAHEIDRLFAYGRTPILRITRVTRAA